jgi:hypothetical protein
MCLKTAVACSLLCSWLLPTVVVANVGPHSSGGQLVAEPMGVAEIAIVRETLAIDLRPLAAAHRDARAGVVVGDPVVIESKQVEAGPSFAFSEISRRFPLLAVDAAS